MERLKSQLALADRALRSLEAVLEIPHPDAIARDAAIQRFEYSFEAVWKCAQRYLRVAEGLQAASPKAVVRASIRVGLLSEEEGRRALAMVDDRNLTVHTYNEPLAQAIHARLPQHAHLMRRWLDTIRARLGEG